MTFRCPKSFRATAVYRSLKVLADFTAFMGRVRGDPPAVEIMFHPVVVLVAVAMDHRLSPAAGLVRPGGGVDVVGGVAVSRVEVDVVKPDQDHGARVAIRDDGHGVVYPDVTAHIDHGHNQQRHQRKSQAITSGSLHAIWIITRKQSGSICHHDFNWKKIPCWISTIIITDKGTIEL